MRDAKIRFACLLAFLSAALALLRVQEPGRPWWSALHPERQAVLAPPGNKPRTSAGPSGGGPPTRNERDAERGSPALRYRIAEVRLDGASRTLVRDINRQGELIGIAQAPDQRAFCILCTHGVARPLSPRGGRLRTVTAINNRSQFVGQAWTREGTHLAFMDSSGEARTLGTLGLTPSMACGVNDAGQVVGWSQTVRGGLRAFLFSEGAMRDLGTLGGEDSEAFAINALGQVVGRSQTSREANHAFLWSGGRMTDLGTLGGRMSEACSINDAGQVVGWSTLANEDTHACRWDGKTLTDLGTLGGRNSWAHDINNAGDIVGESTVDDAGARAFVYRDGQRYDLNRLIPPASGWVLNAAVGINDAGQIAGNGTYHGRPRGFLLTPMKDSFAFRKE